VVAVEVEEVEITHHLAHLVETVAVAQFFMTL
jgi:hypothetical protein